MLPWSPGATPISGVVTWVNCGQVMPPSNDLTTMMLSVPLRSAPNCLVVMYTSLSPCAAIHWRSTIGVSLCSGFTIQVLPPLNDDAEVEEPSHSEVIYTFPFDATARSSSPPPTPPPRVPIAAAAWVPSG